MDAALDSTTQELLNRLRAAVSQPQSEEEFQRKVQGLMRDASAQPGAVQAMMNYLDGLRPAHPLESEGWRYFDPPAKFSPEMWERLLATIGHGNYQVLAVSTGRGGDGQPFKRGQLMISPAGQENLRAAGARARAEVAVQ